MKTDTHLIHQLQKLQEASQAIRLKSREEKNSWLERQPIVQEYLKGPHPLRQSYSQLAPSEKFCLLSLLFLGQGPHIFHPHLFSAIPYDQLRPFLATLLEIESFYEGIGGILGYHREVLLRIVGQEEASEKETINYRQPPGWNFEEEPAQRMQAVLWGLEGLPFMGEIYVVGGAGDRLDLRDPETGRPLPAGLLPFTGRTLIEGLLRDLQAREELYRKVHGQKIVTPVAIMTSSDKENHRHVKALFEEENWFGRPRESFHFFQQPLAPVINREGNWSIRGPLQLTLKPGGHGVLWRLAKEAQIYDWFRKQGRKKALVRQVNNPLAGVDDGLLAFAGVGLKGDKIFGFSSCPRKVGTAEGTNVLIERKGQAEYQYQLTNIEYVEFEKRGLQDHPKEEGSPYSVFPANTNILFVDLDAVEEAVERSPFPGMLINMKKTAPFIDPDGKIREIPAGRLETTMQNIAEDFTFPADHCLTDQEARELPVYLTLNRREKTISVTKNPFRQGKEIHETPFGAFADLMRNSWECFVKYCHFDIPRWDEKECPFHLLYHPALGPLFSVIGQKIRGGSLTKGSEWILEISEIDVEHLSIDGSLHILAQNPLQGGGRCTLKNVKIQNEGLRSTSPESSWKNAWERDGSCQIEIEGQGEFYAEDVQFLGPVRIFVPDGIRVTAQQNGSQVELFEERIEPPTWSWEVKIEEGELRLFRRSIKKVVRS